MSHGFAYFHRLLPSIYLMGVFFDISKQTFETTFQTIICHPNFITLVMKSFANINIIIEAKFNDYYLFKQSILMNLKVLHLEDENVLLNLEH